jgi:hypothetical protein
VTIAKHPLASVSCKKPIHLLELGEILTAVGDDSSAAHHALNDPSLPIPVYESLSRTFVTISLKADWL